METKSKKVFKTPYFEVVKDTVDLDKAEIKYWKLEAPDVSVIISFFRDEIVMVNQYRYAIGKDSLELPAGTLEPGESPEECAKRELEEETGFVAENVRKIFGFYPSNEVTNRYCHVCIADKLTKGKHNRQEDELIDVVLMDETEILDKILDETITDGRTITAMLIKLKEV